MVGRNTKYKTVILSLYFVTSRLLWYDEIQKNLTVLYFVSMSFVMERQKRKTDYYPYQPANQLLTAHIASHHHSR